MPHPARLLSLLALMALAACGEGEAGGAGAAQARQQSARAAAEAALRLRMRVPEQRGVQVFTQALPDSIAVCGRARGAAAEAFIPYVALVAFTGDTPRLASFNLGASGAEASRVFLDMVERCFEGGGPASTRATARSMPPLPEPAALAPPAQETLPAAPAEAATAVSLRPSGATTSVMTSSRMGANLRSSPRGGEVLRSVPPSTRLEVIAEAPGGWYQVGERGVAIGWVHASVLEGR